MSWLLWFTIFPFAAGAWGDVEIENGGVFFYLLPSQHFIPPSFWVILSATQLVCIRVEVVGAGEQMIKKNLGNDLGSYSRFKRLRFESHDVLSSLNISTAKNINVIK